MGSRLIKQIDIPKEVKNCPFCGQKATMTVGITGLKAIVCTDYRNCGAYVTFDNPLANRNSEATILFWNRRAKNDG